MLTYVENFDIGPRGAQVAIVGVSGTVNRYLNLNDTNNLADLQARISSFPAGNVDATPNLPQ